MSTGAIRAVSSERGRQKVKLLKRVGFAKAGEDFRILAEIEDDDMRSTTIKFLDRHYIRKLLDGTGYQSAKLAEEAGIHPNTLWQKVNSDRLRLTMDDARKLFAALRRLGIVTAQGKPTQAACELIEMSPKMAVKAKRRIVAEKEDAMRPLLLEEACWQAYGFEKEPFTDALESELDIYQSPTQKAVLNKLLRAAADQQPIGLLAGKGGGKTVVKRQFVAECRRGRKIHLIESFGFKQQIDPMHIVGELCYGLGMTNIPGRRIERLKKLYEALRTKAEAGKKAVFLLDDAHDVREDTIRFLKQLYEKEYGFRKLFSFVLMGWHRLDAILNDGDPEEVGLRVPFIELRPFKEAQIKSYCEHRIARAGANGNVLSDEVVKAFEKAVPDFGRPVIINNAMRRLLAYNWQTSSKKDLFANVRKYETAIASLEWRGE